MAEALASPVAGGWNVVAAGSWNVPIFTPVWVTEHLTKSKDVGVEVGFGQPFSLLRLTFDDISLSFSEGRLVISPREPTVELMERTASVASRIFEELPHTPLKAIGVNFRFRVVKPTARLFALFKTSDAGALADAGARIPEMLIQRSLEFEGQSLNLRAILEESGQAMVDFNFHKNVASPADAGTYLTGRVKSAHEKAEELLETVYGLQCEEKEVHK